MNRRGFFGSVVATVLSFLVPKPAIAELTKPPRQFQRFDRPNDRWVPVQPVDIRAGDVVWVHDPGGEFNEVLLVSRNAPEEGQFYTTHQINPKTNLWEPHTA